MANLSSKIQGVSQAAMPVITTHASYAAVAGTHIIGSTTSPTFGTVAAGENVVTIVRHGEWAHITWSYKHTAAGTAGTGNYYFILPAGLTVNTAVLGVDLASSLGVGRGNCGSITVNDGTSEEQFDAFAATSTQIQFRRAAFGMWAASTNTNFGDTALRVGMQIWIPIAEWAGQGQLQTASTHQVEYASNSSTSDAADTSSFVYGMSGSSVPGTLTASRSKRVRFQSQIQPSDKFEVEIQVSGNSGWFPVGSNQSGSLAYIFNGTSSAGIYTQAVNSTDIDVIFSTAPRIGENWSSYSSYKWRVRKVSGGIQGFGNATTTTPGLVTLAQLCPTTEWVSYTPTVSNLGTGSSVTNAGKWRRFGDSMEVEIAFIKDGSGGSGSSVVTWTLPTGYTIDAGKLATGTVGNAVDILGSAVTYQLLAASQLDRVYGVFSASTTAVCVAKPATNAGIKGSDLVASSQVGLHFTVPIAEWAGSLPGLVSDAQVEFASNSDTSSTSSVTGSGYQTGTSGQAFSASWAVGTAYVRRVQFANSIQATDDIRIEVDRGSSGAYWVDAAQMFPQTSAGGKAYGIGYNAPGSNYVDLYFSEGGLYPGSAAFGSNGSAWSGLSTWKWRVKKVKSSISALVDNASTSQAGLVTTSAQSFAGVKTFQDTPSFHAKRGSSQTGPNNSSVTVIFDTEEHDTGSGYNNSTGIFTVPVTGRYLFTVSVVVDSVPNGSNAIGDLYKNGSAYSRFFFETGSTGQTRKTIQGSVVVSATAGDQFKVNVVTDLAGATTILSGSGASLFSGCKIA